MTTFAPAHTDTIVLSVSGMSSASSATRIERRLNKVDGVFATVNYATEKATLSYDTGQISVERIIDEIGHMGFAARTADTARDAAPHEPRVKKAAYAEPLIGGAAARIANLRRKVVASGLLAVPVAIFAFAPRLQPHGWQWAVLLLATPVVLWAAAPIHRSALVAAAHGVINVDTLTSGGAIVAYGWSVWRVWDGRQSQLYFSSAVFIVLFALIGRYMELRTHRTAEKELRSLVSYRVQEARLLTAEGEQRIPAQRLKPGQRFAVRAGEKIAADGIVESGESAVDASVLTGESRAVSVVPGSPVTGATLNLSKRIVVVATRVGAESLLAQVAEMVTKAQESQTAAQRSVDRWSKAASPLVLILALATFAVHIYVGHSTGSALRTAVAVAVIACPAAFVLAHSIALLAGVGRGAQLGVVFKDAAVMVRMRRADMALLDKTGTVTTGHPVVETVLTEAGIAPHEIVYVAGALEKYSGHHLGVALTNYLHELGISDPQMGAREPRVGAVANHVGEGVTGLVDGRVVVIGRPQFVETRVAHVSTDLQNASDEAIRAGKTVVAVGWGDQVRGAIVLGDQLRRTSATAVRRLRELGLSPMLVTCDNVGAASRVADELGIPATDVIAGVFPSDKASLVRQLQGTGRVVVMVGDGVQDAVSLTQADVGIAMGSGPELTRQAGDVVVLRSDVGGAADAVRLARRTLRTMRGGLGWAVLYNVMAIPLAMTGVVAPGVASALAATALGLTMHHGLRLREFQV